MIPMAIPTDSPAIGAPYWYDDDADDEQAIAVLEALRRFRRAEHGMRSRTQGDMDMNETDLAALRFLIAAEREGRGVGPTEIAHHLQISTAATAKLIGRLSASGHIERLPHPSDRRAAIIRPTPSSHHEVRRTLERTHRRMLEAARRLTPGERESVVRFLDDVGTAMTVRDDD
ncbi:MarR family transcriptional regulator [Glaciibacter flavus]|uniref:MarR family transcriptional regulator n=2 Tax=Orlajensenia flava TaxID=2565934 RepID=A0A4S4G031_9MICO|nr:MarR family transcriptional regulator [Glaciibacter flavus]